VRGVVLLEEAMSAGRWDPEHPVQVCRRDLARARGMMSALRANGDEDTSQYRLFAIAAAAIEYGQSEHVGDANCSAGDCDSCSAKDALRTLEALVGGPE
jgi:hypothetical protein